MTGPTPPPHRPVPAAVAERVTASAQRTRNLRERAASLDAQLSPGPAAPAQTDRAERDRLLAAHAVAAGFYRAQLDGPDGDGPSRYLAGLGVPVDGRWVVGYAPDRPTALVNELRRRGFTDTEIAASGLSAPGRGGQLIDRFRNRVMVGVRDHLDPRHPVVGFVGQAPPRAEGVAPVVYSPGTIIYRPGLAVFGVAEQAEGHPSAIPPVVATDALSAIVAAETDNVTAVAPCTPALTARQAATLTAAFDTAAGIVVTVRGGDDGRHAAERAYAVLAPAYRHHPTRPGPLLAARPGDLADTPPLLDVVVTGHVAWASRFVSDAGRRGAARTVQAMLADADPETAARLGEYTARRLGVPMAQVTTAAPAAATVPDNPVAAPQVLAGAATPTGPPTGPDVTAPSAPASPSTESTSPAAEETADEPLRGPGPQALAGVPAPEVRDVERPEQLLLDFGGAGSDPDRAAEPGTGRSGPARGGLPGQGRPAEQREDARGGGDPAGADPDPSGDRRGPGPGRRPAERDRDGAGDGRVGAVDRGPDTPVLAAGGRGRGRPGRGPAEPVTPTADPVPALPRAAGTGSAAPSEPPAAAAEPDRPDTRADEPASDQDVVQDVAERPAAEPPAAEPPAAEPPAAEPGAAVVYRPSDIRDVVPRTESDRLPNNLAALRTLRTVQAEDRPATAAEQAVMARWTSWGALPGLFEARTNHPNYAKYATERAELRELLSDAEFAAAERTTINAHYTDLAYVQAIWQAAAGLGFDGGTVLEPGCGAGIFIGLAPDGARPLGVELDPVTAGIAAALYPHAEIRAESFADTRAPTGSVDLTVGNVPFADVQLHDRKHNPGKHVMHNHFLIKSLHLTRPGGLVMALTSRYTMDSANPAARREMMQLADLVAAIRLPSGAHDRTAGTKAVTDLLILRRREPDREPAGVSWEQVRPLDAETTATKGDQVNEYFFGRPEHVLGEMSLGRGMYRDGELLVKKTGDPATQLHEVLREVVERAGVDGLTMSPRDESIEREPVAVLAPADRGPGHIEQLPDGSFTTVTEGQVVAHPVPQTQAAELQALLGLRDTVTALLAAEAASLDDGDEPGVTPDPASPAGLRAQLNTRYDAYTAAYGPLNRFTLRRTGRFDPETGEPKTARQYPPMGGFRRVDPHAAAVFALENFDDANQRATKADIFTQRVILPRAAQLGADTAEDALAICLDAHGEVRLSEVARLLGVDEVEARAALGELVYDDPGTGDVVEAAGYLSGNVRTKLAAAREAAETDARFETNVRALAKVIPRDLGPGEIDAAFGAPFIAAGYVQQFLQEALRDPGLRVDHSGGSDWRVRGQRHGVQARSTWGTPGMAAPDLAQRLLTKTPIRVFYEVEEGKRALDVEATAAAQAKAAELEERYAAWVWEDPDRAAAIAGRYNDMFNNSVPRSYVGVTRTLPGLAATFTPRPHQVEAVARIVNEPAVGLFHDVGAGKTAVMAMSAMEMRRLGLVTKPALVVPNHMLEQFSREFLQIYPQAKLLAAGRDDSKTPERRRQFVARSATGDWDAVILAASTFESLPLSKEEQRRFQDAELQELRDKIVSAAEQAIANGKDPDRSSNVKRLQKALLKKEERIKAKLDKVKDTGISFEATGIDFVYRDEIHELKNDTITSSISDAQNDGSDRAVDFRMKIDYLRRERGARVVCGATATPIANSVRELYVVTRQLRPDLLAATGTLDFDTWAATFARVVTAIEVSPTGAGFQMRARLAKYRNVPELSLMMRTFGDVRTREDLGLPIPLQTVREDGQRAPHIITMDASDELAAFISSLDERVERVRNRQVEPEVDNMLKISGEARSASLDMRLIGEQQLTPGKVDAAAGRIAAIWADTRDNLYPGSDQPGALQIVFCDQSTPGGKNPWNVYDALAAELVGRGMPREKIRYIHEADTDAKKASLFAACRTGEVAVLIGSTAKMGVGTNVQARAVALHHMDCPWRPADVTQREGRILRQGNLNAEVSIYRYVVAGSFDAFSWQTVARKGSFIDQIMRGTAGREIDDVSDETLQAHQIKAIATGNPLLMDREEVSQEVTRLDRGERAHHNTQAALRRQIAEAQGYIAADTRKVQIYTAAIDRRVDTRGDKFAMTVAGHPLTKRPDAGRALQHALTAAAAGISNTDRREVTGLARLGGFDVNATIWSGKDGLLVSIKLDEVPDPVVVIKLTDAVEGDPTGLVRRLENHLGELDAARKTVERRITSQQQEIALAEQQLGQTYPRRDDLVDARNRLRAIDAVIDLMADDTPTAAAAPPAAEVTIADWMPTELHDSLAPDEQAWLEQRVQHAAMDGALQAAARTQEIGDFSPTFAKALTKALGDPGNPHMAVAILLKCDDPAWRDTLVAAAGHAVHRTVRETPPPPPTTPAAADPSTPAPGAPASPMTPEEIVAATTAADRALLTGFTNRALQVDAVQDAVRGDDRGSFDTAFHTAIAAAISDFSLPDQVDTLRTLHADQAFRAGLASLVWTKIAPAVRAEPRPQQPAEQPTAAAAAAAVAAQAFMPTGPGVGTAPSAAPTSPAPARAAGREPAESRPGGER
jgi:N12 class adenine-specific DNA methylase